MLVFAFVGFPSIAECCVRPHRNQTPLTGSKDGGLVVFTRNVSTTAAAVTIADSGGNGGCCCGCDDGGDVDGEGDGGGCGGCGHCGGCGGCGG